MPWPKGKPTKAPATAWKKGQSGNPGGRFPTKVDGVHIPTIARQYGVDAIKTLNTIMTGPKYPPAARVRAAELLLERGFGKAPAVVVMPKGQGGVDLESLTDEELAIYIAGGELEVTPLDDAPVEG